MDYELAIYRTFADAHSVAVLRASHYNEFAKALALLTGFSELGDAVREVGDALAAGTSTSLTCGPWYIELAAPAAIEVVA